MKTKYFLYGLFLAPLVVGAQSIPVPDTSGGMSLPTVPTEVKVPEVTVPTVSVPAIPPITDIPVIPIKSVPDVSGVPKVSIPPFSDDKKVTPDQEFGLDKIFDGDIKVTDDGVFMPGFEVRGKKIVVPGGVEIDGSKVKTPFVEIEDDKINYNDGQIIIENNGIFIDTENAKIKIKGKDITIEKASSTDIGGGGGMIQIKSGGIVVDSDETVKIEKGKITVLGADKKSITVDTLPDEALEVADAAGDIVDNVLLAVRGDVPVYDIVSKKKAKLFGIFDVLGEVKTLVDAKESKVISKDFPWWWFAAF